MSDIVKQEIEKAKTFDENDIGESFWYIAPVDLLAALSNIKEHYEKECDSPVNTWDEMDEKNLLLGKIEAYTELINELK